MKANEIKVGMKVCVPSDVRMLKGRRKSHVGVVEQIIRRPIWLAEVATRKSTITGWFTAGEIMPYQPRRKATLP